MKSRERPRVPDDRSPSAQTWIWLIGGAAAGLAVALVALALARPSRPPSAFAVAKGPDWTDSPGLVPKPPAADPRDPTPPPLNPPTPPGPAPEGMVWVPGGTFWMGSDDPMMRDAQPVHRVTLDGFWMDRTEVTNAEFARFVEETGYVTFAEKPPDPKSYPGAPAENLVAGSIVFTPPDHDVTLDNFYAWWRYVPGASWRHPEGPGSSIEGREDHPVVHVCYEDAEAYARWAGKRLPTEAEWEFAARGGLDRQRYVWGNELRPGGAWVVNNWQGAFPRQNAAEDGYERTAPVGRFPPNGYGLFDMAGNAWEWCSDWYRAEYYHYSPDRNPTGPESSHDPHEPGVPKRVQRGGSFLCSDLYCVRYLPGARGKGAVDSGQSHVGFRCVRPATAP